MDNSQSNSMTTLNLDSDTMDKVDIVVKNLGLKSREEAIVAVLNDFVDAMTLVVRQMKLFTRYTNQMNSLVGEATAKMEGRWESESTTRSTTKKTKRGVAQPG